MTLHVSKEGVLTIKTERPHGFKQGETIVIGVSGKEDRWLVTVVPNDKEFSAIRDRRTRVQRRAQAAQLRKHYGA
jgi:hypothetical protein